MSIFLVIMSAARSRYSAQQAAQRLAELQEIATDDSDDSAGEDWEDDETSNDAQAELYNPLAEDFDDDQPDGDDDNDDDDADESFSEEEVTQPRRKRRAPASLAAAASTANAATSSASSAYYLGKDGTKWLKAVPAGGRRAQRNVVTQQHGLPRRTKSAATSELESLLMMIDPHIIKLVIEHTNKEASRQLKEKFDKPIDEAEFLAFLGLYIARGVLIARNEPVHALWSQEYGRDLFCKTMPRNRFQEICRFLRFDDKDNRPQRRNQDKFCLIRDIWDRFVKNCIDNYYPSPYITVDEQLLPTKARCPFTQYMPSKPGKFGIKFWILADASTPYVMNIKPYLGKNFDDDRHGVPLGEHVVLKLCEPFTGHGYNVTTDNFFTSKHLAEELSKKATSLVGTVRGNRRELAPHFTDKKRKVNSVLQGYDEKSGCIVLSSQVKKGKVVNVLSSMHSLENVPQDGSRKATVIEFYNNTKFGVDRVDQMCRLYSTKAGGRRWPVHVFSNMLDIAGINAHTVYRLASGKEIQRRQFLLNICQLLAANFVAQATIPPHVPGPDAAGVLEKRVYCQLCKKNKTRASCVKCSRPVCGTCSKPACCAQC